MKRRRAATPYAKALFELARERAEAELVGRELGNAAAIFDVAELRDFFARPWIPPAVKRAVAAEIAQRSKFSKLTADFLALVAGGGRTDHVKVIAEKYDKRLDEDLGRVRARVRTAVPLTDKEREMLSAKLGKVLGAAGWCSRRSSTAACSAVSSSRATASFWMGVSKASSTGCVAVSRVTRMGRPRDTQRPTMTAMRRIHES